jgi:hypothetical protein
MSTPGDYSKQEQFLMKRLTRTRKLFGFLREARHEPRRSATVLNLETIHRLEAARAA